MRKSTAKAAGDHRYIAVTENSMKPKTGGRAMSETKKLRLLPIVLALSVASVITTRAQVTDYPNRPIQVIVPFAGGSASDVVTRVLLQEMSKSLGQNFIVENRPGAGGNSGTATAAKASPNGYMLVMSTSGPLAANKTLFKTLGYEPEKDFAPISLFAILPNVIVINSKLPPKTLTEFIAYAKAHPKLNYGSVGVGSSQHLAGVYFEQITGVQLTHVPYRYIAQYTPDFVEGAVPLGFQFLPNVLGMLQSGDARALAVTSNQRMTALPEAVKSPAVRARFIQFGAEPVSSGPEELQKFIVSETAKWRDIIQKAGIPPL